jgi:outer membrane protein assembly factor BamA
MKWNVWLVLVISFSFVLSFAMKSSGQSSSSSPVRVIWELNSPLLFQLPPDGQGLVRLRLVGREFQGQQLDEVTERFKEALQNLGYLMARVSAATVEPLGNGRPLPVRLNYTGDLGPRYRLHDVQWRNVTRLPVEQLAQLVPMQNGDVFDTGKVRELLEGARRLYMAHGYNDFTVVPQTMVDEDTHTVQLVLDVGDGSLQSRR